MNQVYHSDPSNIPLNVPSLKTEIEFFVNNKGKLYRILWQYGTFIKENLQCSCGDEKAEGINLDEVSENDLFHAFKELALKNPSDFKTLYFTLKEHDNITFPSIKKALEEIQETFNFD